MWRQKPIDNFIVDFYCPKLKLAIEVDGDSHFTPECVAYDAEITKVLEGYGLQVIRFTNHQVLRDFEAVCQEIVGFIPPSTPWECEFRFH
jgi:very-short-patch-repair endonuclease